MGYCLGIDLGTTFTAAAIARDGRAEMAVLGSRTAAVPSVVFMGAEAGEVLVGEAARRRVATDPARVVREFKRRLGDATPIFVGDTPRSAESLMALVLAWVVDKVTEQEGGPPEATVVCRPANWGAYRCELLEHAIRQSEVPNASTVTEPEAAAVFYASTERVEPGQLVAVYDLGGGTFDAALLRKTAVGFEPVGTPEGIEHLGGVDFDEAIFEHVRRNLGATLGGLDPDDPATLRALVRLREECTEAKEALSFDAAATVPVLLPGVQTEVVITRGELEGMIRPLVADTIAALRRAFATAGADPAEAQTVLLVGGSSRIPLIGEMITAELGRPVAVDAHPKHAIALGAALTAYSLHTGTEAAPSAELPPEPGRVTSLTGKPEMPAPQTARSRRPLLIGAAVTVALIIAIALLAGGGGDGGEEDAATTLAPAPTTGPTTTAPAATTTTATTATIEAGPVEVPTGPPLDAETIVYGRVQNENCNIWRVNADGSSAQALTNETAVCAQQPVLSPDRRSIAFTVSDGDEWQLWVTDSFGDGEQVLVDDLAPGTRAAWSPDGGRIAFVSTRDGPKDLFVLDLETGEAENLTGNAAEEGAPAWSSDGDRLAFWAKVEGNSDIYVHSISSGETTRLTTDPGEDSDPAWQPGGGSLAFGSSRDGDWDIYLMDEDGGNQRAITDDPSADEDPSWSPDGGRIVFNSKRDTPDQADFAELYVMNADGTGLQRITTLDGLDAHPAWGSAS